MRGYPQKYVIYTQPVIEPMGEARSDTDIIFGLAQKLGLDYQDYDGAAGSARDGGAPLDGPTWAAFCPTAPPTSATPSTRPWTGSSSPAA